MSNKISSSGGNYYENNYCKSWQYLQWQACHWMWWWDLWINCLIKKGDLYDLETNEERLSLEQAMKKYPYVGQNWQDEENVIVVNTYQPTPIWCILDKQTGKWYNKEWKEIEKPFN